MKQLISLIITVALLAGCVHERVIVRESVPNSSDEIATQEPPPAIEERVTIAPTRVHVWIGGHWAWRRGAYTWAPGYWARRPNHNTHWAPGLWIRHGHGWRWRHGRWH